MVGTIHVSAGRARVVLWDVRVGRVVLPDYDKARLASTATVGPTSPATIGSTTTAATTATAILPVTILDPTCIELLIEATKSQVTERTRNDGAALKSWQHVR